MDIVIFTAGVITGFTIGWILKEIIKILFKLNKLQENKKQWD